jgi:hypothetical protein
MSHPDYYQCRALSLEDLGRIQRNPQTHVDHACSRADLSY